MSFLADLLDLLLPETCAGCGLRPGRLCSACAVPLAGAVRPAEASVVPDLPPVWTVTAYEGTMRAILSAYKERGRMSLAIPLGEALAQAVQTALANLATRVDAARGFEFLGGGAGRGGVLLVPVPSARGAVRRRGHDPMRRMAAVAVRRLRADGLEVVGLGALWQGRRVADQAGLTAKGRVANLTGALEAVPGVSVEGRMVVLADDVITTGASLGEAARVLRGAGAEVVAAATVAATPRKW